MSPRRWFHNLEIGVVTVVGLESVKKMKNKAVSGIMLTLLLASMLTLSFNIQPVRASGAIYIRADGSIDPPTANITSADNVTYTFIGNIVNYSIVVERDNIVVDGTGYTLQGLLPPDTSAGISCMFASNVIIRNVKIKLFYRGIWIYDSPNTTISGNNITKNSFGIYVGASPNTTISGNNITRNIEGIYLCSSPNNAISGNNIINNEYGIWFVSFSGGNNISGNNITDNRWGIFSASSNNIISGNHITANWERGIYLHGSSNNTISGNNITKNLYGVYFANSHFNKIYHNNFMDNTQQVYIYSPGYANFWDDGYPSGGNYWSDYAGNDTCSGPYQNVTGSDGIGDTPYVIGGDNEDRYPLMSPWISSPEEAIKSLIGAIESMNLQQGIDSSLDAKIDAVLKSLEALNADQRGDAINKLYAFINEVEAQRGQKITNEQADYLIAEAQEIISLIEG